MPNYIKLTSIFQLTTTPEDLSRAVAHTGGWSESVWTSSAMADALPLFSGLQAARAALLPASASIIGYRATTYELVFGRFLQPKETEAARRYFPGVIGIATDVPQMAIHLQMGNAAGSNSNLTLRGIPDAMIVGGEWAPQGAYAGLMRAFQTQLVRGSWGNIGRDRTQASVRVVSYSNSDGLLLGAFPATGLSIGDYVRFNRTVDSFGRTLSGSYQVATLPGGNVVILRGVPANTIISKPSGTVRRDVLSYGVYTKSNIVRSVVKKVGAPFEKYRGRRSKRRAS